MDIQLASQPDAEDFFPARPRSKAIYLLPNAFTTAALFFGFFSIVQAMNQKWEMAAIAIFCSLVLDGMDGRVARMTNTQSAFGEQYDSLADMVSFGVAPALVAYEWSLKGLGRWGWLAAFVYCAGAALRLARFNISTTVVDKRFFQGLPSPAAASIIAGFVWLVEDNKLPVHSYAIPLIMFFLTIYAGTTMVSNVLFYSGKALDIKYKVSFGVMLLVILAFVLISSDPPLTLFCLFVIYALSGYIRWVWLALKKPKNPTLSN
ncbi:CDP-diacylglycerol--serine O-phosphatidyltransferase [Polynucleobacter rarus]|uniref:CDP-diacylglycerol--serine O-phosphatidyltransferase n=1 Tax=Polynucleobacter rarus TaxID=556055 RepID=UPI000D3E287A|nr:CDP-diacylglycerol--serine O-phosphatidyltransferase [Polynucleobacter rarus]